MNLLITGAWQDAKEHVPEIEKLGHKVVFLQWEQDALPCDAAWIEGVICNGLFLHHPIQQFTNLRYIQLTSAGYDRVPMEYVKAHDIEIHNARGVYSIPMAEFAVASVLSLYKKLNVFCEQQKRHEWKKHRDLRELYGKNVLIVGCGDVGTECAKRFRAFGCPVLGVNRTPRMNPNYEEIHPLSELDALLPEADIVILAIGLSPETRHLMNAERLNRMKSGTVLVNIARGGLIDTQALMEALPKLCGAVLDVFEEEPLPEGSRLWGAGNVILAPHNSFAGEGNGARLAEVFLKSLRKEAIL